MRIRSWIAAMVATPLLALPAMAQTTFTFGGADPTKIVNQPIAIPQTTDTSFSLSNLFPRFSLLPGAKTLFGQSAFPTQKNMPGKGYLRNFGYQRPQPVD
jgi:hypothetical protein